MDGERMDVSTPKDLHLYIHQGAKEEPEIESQHSPSGTPVCDTCVRGRRAAQVGAGDHCMHASRKIAGGCLFETRASQTAREL